MGTAVTKPLARWLRWGYRVALAGVVVILLSYLPYRFLARQDQGKLAEMRAELSRVESEIHKQEAELGARRQKVDALKNDTGMIEDIARQELQMLYPHEKALRLKRKRQ